MDDAEGKEGWREKKMIVYNVQSTDSKGFSGIDLFLGLERGRKIWMKRE